MIEGNPYLAHPNRIRGIQEVPAAVFRLKTSFEQRITSTAETAQSFLDNAVLACVDTGFFTENADVSKIKRKVGSGFNTSVYLFQVDEQPWVAKIGAKKAPVPGWFDPSSKEYAQWYANNLTIVRNKFKDKLPYLIPSPQFVTHQNNSEGEQTSVIIQPFIGEAYPVNRMSSKSEEYRVAILEELKAFYDGFEELYVEHNFIPDLGTKGNLVVQPVGDDYHLTLLDNGMIDFNAVSPVLNTWSMFRYRTRPKGYMTKLARSIK